MGKPYFADNGVHVLVDGQFGSTGKGVLAAYLARHAVVNDTPFVGVISNAGPNSGHTFYHDDEKHVLKQLPTFAVASYLLGRIPEVHLSAGAIINPDILRAEAAKYRGLHIYVHPNAAVVTQADKDAELVGSIAAVAGTRSGTGAVQARKVNREPDAIWDTFGHSTHNMPHNVHTMREPFNPKTDRLFMEVSQGFSLGINSQFYPKVTSRECTVMQAIADARIAPKFVSRTYMVARTLPIRVGNVDGHSSGDMYHDQREMEWSEIGVTPELTTVTQRERRLFSFSVAQMVEAIQANQPDFLLMNFMNYLSSEEQHQMVSTLQAIKEIAGTPGLEILYGYGPKSSDVVPF